MQSAAGGTSHRLKPAFAIVCSRSRIPSLAPDITPALLTVVIASSLQPPVPGMSVDHHPVVTILHSAPVPTLLPSLSPHIFRDAPGSRSASQILTPDATA